MNKIHIYAIRFPGGGGELNLFLTFHILTKKMNKLKYNKNITQNRLLLTCKLLHVSAARFNLQGVYEKQSIVSATRTSDASRPQSSSYKLKILKS